MKNKPRQTRVVIDLGAVQLLLFLTMMNLSAAPPANDAFAAAVELNGFEATATGGKRQRECPVR